MRQIVNGQNFHVEFSATGATGSAVRHEAIVHMAPDGQYITLNHRRTIEQSKNTSQGMPTWQLGIIVGGCAVVVAAAAMFAWPRIASHPGVNAAPHGIQAHLDTVVPEELADESPSATVDATSSVQSADTTTVEVPPKGLQHVASI